MPLGFPWRKMPPGGLRRVALLGCGVDLVLDETTLAEANRRIAGQYRIPRLRYQQER